MNVKGLMESWNMPLPSEELTQVTLRIPTSDYARLHALKEVYENRVVNDIASDLLNKALDEVVKEMAKMKGVIGREEAERIVKQAEDRDIDLSVDEVIGNPTGKGYQFENAYNRIMAEKRKEKQGVDLVSMFTVTGKVVKTFFQEGQLDKETGELEEGKNKVQIMGEVPVKGGESKFDLLTLSVPDELNFESLIEKEVSVPLGFFSPAKGQIVYFIPKGSVPLVRSDQNL